MWSEKGWYNFMHKLNKYAILFVVQAANPGCLLEDFVRWYSPNDWIPGKETTEEAEELKHLKADAEQEKQETEGRIIIGN